MKFRSSLIFLATGIFLISMGIFTQMVGVAHANPSGMRQSQANPQPTPVVPPFTDIACLECHTDQDTLKLLAVEKEVVESHSEGPG